MHNHTEYGLSVFVSGVVVGGGGARKSSFLNFNCLEGISYVFLWTEKGLAFLDRSWTEMQETHPTPTGKTRESRTLFYEYPFINTVHHYVLKRYNFSC